MVSRGFGPVPRTTIAVKGVLVNKFPDIWSEPETFGFLQAPLPEQPNAHVRFQLVGRLQYPTVLNVIWLKMVLCRINRRCKGRARFLKHAEVILDGQALDNLSRYRVTTPPTTVVFPDDAIYGAPKGGTTLVADVLLPMIRPLSRGNHSLSFKTHNSSYWPII
jgi:hypothetical protein